MGRRGQRKGWAVSCGTPLFSLPHPGTRGALASEALLNGDAMYAAKRVGDTAPGPKPFSRWKVKVLLWGSTPLSSLFPQTPDNNKKYESEELRIITLYIKV